MNALISRRSIGMLLLVAASLASPAKAGVLWYNGDFDKRASLTNENVVPINTGSGYVLQKSLVYDNFVVPVGQTWTITSVFSNNQMAYYVPATTATWEIRAGVSAGNGGTLKASGDSTATQTLLTQSNGTTYPQPEYQVSVTIAPLVLTAGTYWLTVAPDSAGYYGDQSYVETTSGANAIGVSPGNDGQSFISNTYPATGTASYNFTPTTTAINKRGVNIGANIDFSMGVSGSSALAVPEPASVTLVVLGLAGSMAWAKRRRSSPAL